MLGLFVNMKNIIYTLLFFSSFGICDINRYDVLLTTKGEKNMAYTYKQGFEDAKSSPGTLVDVELQGNGGDGVYAMASWDGFQYNDRQVWIDDQVTYSGNRSLKHTASRDNTVSTYTGTESLISPGTGTQYDAKLGGEMWARMMMYVPEGTDWRTGSNGTGSTAEPKLFRVYWRHDHWLTTYLQASRGGSSEPSWYRNTYPTGIAVGIRFEVDHDNGPGPINYGTSAPWTIPGSRANFTYVAPFVDDYANFIIPYGRWVSLEHYVYFNTSGGIMRFWLDETLVYEQELDTWSAQNRNAPHSVVGILTVSNWAGLPTTSTTFYTDDYIITDDPGNAVKTDSRGNKMIGKSTGTNGSNGSNGKGPVLSDIQSVVDGTNVIITWTTDIPATSVVEYGETTRYGSTKTVPGETVNHQVVLDGLNSNTQYHWRVISSANGKDQPSHDRTFTTGQTENGGDLPEYVNVRASNISIAVDGVGRPHIALYDHNEDKFKYAVRKDGIWKFEDVS